MAMEESRVLIWHRDKLKLSIITEPFLQTVFDHILGRDVVKKLMQVTQVSTNVRHGFYTTLTKQIFILSNFFFRRLQSLILSSFRILKLMIKFSNRNYIANMNKPR